MKLHQNSFFSRCMPILQLWEQREGRIWELNSYNERKGLVKAIKIYISTRYTIVTYFYCKTRYTIITYFYCKTRYTIITYFYCKTRCVLHPILSCLVMFVRLQQTDKQIVLSLIDYLYISCKKRKNTCSQNFFDRKKHTKTSCFTACR